MAEPERRAFMHSWCGTLVVTESLPAIAGREAIPAGNVSGSLCPNPECSKPDFPWWTSTFSGTETYHQMRLEFDIEIRRVMETERGER